MRVIAGSLRGRVFNPPRGNRTHPMSEKVRGSLFNALGDISGLRVLDSFAGSGALCFEAISRGAKHALAVEIDKSAQRTISENIKMLGLEHAVKAVRANASGWSDNNKSEKFDLLFLDPPYDELQFNLLQKLTRHLHIGALAVLSWPGKLAVPEFMGLKHISGKNYGDAQLVFYRKTG